MGQKHAGVGYWISRKAAESDSETDAFEGLTPFEASLSGLKPGPTCKTREYTVSCGDALQGIHVPKGHLFL